MTARFVSVVVVGLVLAVAAACDSGDGKPDPTATPSPTASATLSVTPSATPARSANPQTPFRTTYPSISPPATPVITPDPILLHDLDVNRAKWNAAGIANYQYGFTLACFCGFDDMPYTVVVRDGEAQSMTNVFGVLLTPAPLIDDLKAQYSTIDLLFEWAEKAIREGSGVRVMYDATYGFPNEVDVGSFGPTDTGSQVTVSDFEVLS